MRPSFWVETVALTQIQRSLRRFQMRERSGRQDVTERERPRRAGAAC
jgi:hypothetical protein